MARSSPERENPAQVELDGVSDGIEALPKRVDRYGKAKKSALDIGEYMATMPKHQAMAHTVKGCGNYLLFRHFFTIDTVKLHAASFCRKHLLCPLCAIRRGAKALAAYLERFEAIKRADGRLNAFLVTLTIQNGVDLGERFDHLHKSQRELWKRKQRRRGSVLDQVQGAVWSYEVKRGSGSGVWHPHIHMIVLAETMTLEGKDNPGPLSAEWYKITGDSHMVDVRPISQDDPASGFVEVFKYAVKFSDQDPADTVHAWETLAGKRLIASAGCFRGVEIPEDLTDDPGDYLGLPYVDLLYRYLCGRYSRAA